MDVGYDIAEQTEKLTIQFIATEDEEEELFQTAWERLRNGGHVSIEVKQNIRTGMQVILSFAQPQGKIPNDATFSRPAIAGTEAEIDEN